MERIHYRTVVTWYKHCGLDYYMSDLSPTGNNPFVSLYLSLRYHTHTEREREVYCAEADLLVPPMATNLKGLASGTLLVK